MAFPWKLTKGTREMRVYSPSMLTDHNMKTQSISLSPYVAFSFALPLCICLARPLFRLDLSIFLTPVLSL